MSGHTGHSQGGSRGSRRGADGHLPVPAQPTGSRSPGEPARWCPQPPRPRASSGRRCQTQSLRSVGEGLSPRAPDPGRRCRGRPPSCPPTQRRVLRVTQASGCVSCVRTEALTAHSARRQLRLTSATLPITAAPRAWRLVVCRSGEPAVRASSRNPQFHRPHRLAWRHGGAAAWGGHPDPRAPSSRELLLRTPSYPRCCPGDLARGTSPASPLRGGCWRVLAWAARSRRGVRGGLGAGSAPVCLLCLFCCHGLIKTETTRNSLTH